MVTPTGSRNIYGVKFEISVTTSGNRTSEAHALSDLSDSLNGISFMVDDKRHTIEVTGDWAPTMDAVEAAYARVLQHTPGVALHLWVSDQESRNAERVEEASRESFPASDPPATNPGRA